MRRVVVTGLGAVSPIGNNVPDFWKSLCDGRGGIARITEFDPTNFDSQIAGEVKGFDPSPYLTPKELKRMDSFVQFAVVASYEAIKDSGIDLGIVDRNRIGVIIGSGIGSLKTVEEQTRVMWEKGPGRMSPFLIPMLIVNMAAGQVSICLGLGGPNSCVATACATGSHSIGDAAKIIQRGDADAMLAGGTEACITNVGIGSFCAMKALSTRNDDPEHASRPFELDRDGFIMGEGAGVVLLEDYEHAKKRGAKIYAEFVGYGMTGDAYHITAPIPGGSGAARAMRASLNDAKLNPEDVSYINAHGTSTKLNDKVETLAMKTVFGEKTKIPISSIKSMTGHLLGAAGGVEFVACCLAMRDNVAPPTINYNKPDPECDLDYVPNVARKIKMNVIMSNSLGFGGH
ncbi:MAG: beta-ketoacyl-ACP synthase II, partial [Candidatus Omnitrophica bacterium]|nr:beta-ketoacyl-ACP synthase II [Candidatus Omnitrophota bacterium]